MIKFILKKNQTPFYETLKIRTTEYGQATLSVVGGLRDSVDTVNVGIQVLVFWVVRILRKAVRCSAIALAHSGLALIVGSCRERAESAHEHMHSNG